jgi:hypothetical protein
MAAKVTSRRHLVRRGARCAVAQRDGAERSADVADVGGVEDGRAEVEVALGAQPGQDPRAVVVELLVGDAEAAVLAAGRCEWGRGHDVSCSGVGARTRAR